MSGSTIALTAAAMREADRRTIEEIGIDGRVLMENAGREAVSVLKNAFGPLERLQIGILCGKGNNGGDGWVMARLLHGARADVRILALGTPDSYTPDARANVHALRSAGFPGGFIHQTPPDGFFERDVLVDALLGTGLSSAPRPPVDDWIRRINAANRHVLAVDVPSGLHSDSGHALGEAVEATITVSMACRKIGTLLGSGPRYAGRVEVVDIGIPAPLLMEAAKSPGCALVSSDALVRTNLPRRPRDAHKYTTGPGLVIGGSSRYPGAPVLAALAAGRAGCGYVQVALPETIATSASQALIEVPPLALPARNGGLSADSVVPDLEKALGRARAILIGPGLGRSEGTTAFVERVLRAAACRVVIDADGLNALADTRLLAEAPHPNWILTPHGREFERLGGNTAATPVEAARAFADRHSCVLVLKGTPTVVAAAGQPYVFVVHDPTPALATAGSGDVLAGLVTGLLARGMVPAEAAVAAAHIGTAAAHRYGRSAAPSSMMAGDLLRQVGPVLLERFF